ncbi:unnamed protein product [Haemonchus placei]|uniref:Uncharacterized protein n=1 Tax=Haemonchus placei TaxID=6290 RepID=A0A0N4W5R3_HAEPC|nr:unnamed protein product [Haemonchus placei]
MPLVTPRDRRSGGPDTLCDIVMTVLPGPLRSGSLGTSSEHHDGRQRDGRTSSRKLWTKGMFCPMSLERVRFTGLLWFVTETNGDVTGARSRKLTIKWSTGDTGEFTQNLEPLRFPSICEQIIHLRLLAFSAFATTNSLYLLFPLLVVDLTKSFR